MKARIPTPVTNNAGPIAGQEKDLPGLVLSLVRELTVYGLSDSIARGLNIILVPLYARFLTTSTLGQLDVLTATVTLGNYLTLLGFDSSEARYFYDTDDRRDQKTTLSTSLVFQIFCGLVLFLIFFLLRRDFATAFLGSEGAGYLVTIAALTFPVFPILRMARNHLRRLRQPKRYALLQTLYIVLALLSITVLVARFRLSVLGGVVGTLVAVVVATLVSVPLMRGWVANCFSYTRLRQLLAYGLPLLPAGIAVWTTALIDRYFVGYYRTLPELGLYSMANMVANGATLLTGPISLGWLPFVQSIRRRPEANEVYRKFFIASVVGFGGVWVVVSIFSPEILRLFATASYLGIVGLIPLLVLSVILNAYYFIGGTGMAVAFRQQFIGLATVVGALTNIALNFLLIPRYGIVGAAVSTLVSQAVTIVLIIVRSQQIYAIDYRWDQCALVIGFSTAAIIIGLGGIRGAFLLVTSAKVVLVVMLFLIFEALGIISMRKTLQIFRNSFCGSSQKKS